MPPVTGVISWLEGRVAKEESELAAARTASSRLRDAGKIQFHQALEGEIVRRFMRIRNLQQKLEQRRKAHNDTTG